jgi:hypothetical protein
MMRIVTVLSVASLMTALLGAVVTAAPPTPPIGPDFDHVFGSGTVEGNGRTVDIDVDAYSAPDGSHAFGSVVVSTDWVEHGPATIHGDVRTGCLKIIGSDAWVIGRIPGSEQWIDSFVGRVQFAAAIVEDNGVGGANDKAIGLALVRSTATDACGAGTPTFYPLSDLLPLQGGDFTIADH